MIIIFGIIIVTLRTSCVHRTKMNDNCYDGELPESEAAIVHLAGGLKGRINHMVMNVANHSLSL